MSLAGVPFYWPGGVRREGGASLICCFCMERGKARADTANPYRGGVVRRGERECTKQQKLLGVEYRSGCAGGPARTSEEIPVMGMERRGRLICGLLARATR
jgi:hypothetical protein